MITEGAWTNSRNLMYDKNPKIKIASIELMANLSLTETIQKRIYDGKCSVDI